MSSGSITHMRALLPAFFPWQHRGLIFQFVRREVLGRYRGSLLGVGWSFVTPLLMLGVYTFVFVGVFKARWPGVETGGGSEFALQIFAGLMVFNLFAEIAQRAPLLVLEQPNLVKKVVFPLEILPWISVLTGVFHLLISSLVLLAGILLVRGEVSASFLALPVVVLPFVILLLGMSWLLAALGVFIRDIGQIMGMLTSLAMFLSPVFYSTDSLSPAMRHWMPFNPMALIIEQVRQTALSGEWPTWQALAIYCLPALLFAVLGIAFFSATRRGFADVL